MAINPSRGDNSTTPVYWPTTPDVSQQQLNSWQNQYGFVPRSLASVDPQQDSLTYYDAVQFLNRRRAGNEFLVQRQQEMEDQGAFVHPEKKWTEPVDDAKRMEADEEYKQALIQVRQNYKNSKGGVPENVRQATYKQQMEQLEEWYKARTTANYTRPAYENNPQEKRHLAWEDAKTENPADYALDDAVNDSWGQNSGVKSYRKYLDDRRMWAEMNGRRDLANKYLGELLQFDPTRGVKEDASNLEVQKRISDYWDKKSIKDRGSWEYKIEERQKVRNAAEEVKGDNRLLELLNEALSEGDSQIWNQRDNFEKIKDSYGDKWTHHHTVAWDNIVRKAFKNKESAEYIASKDPSAANAARREARAENEKTNKRRAQEGKHPVPLTATDVAGSLRNIYEEYDEYYDIPDRPDESNFVPEEKTEEYEFFDPQAGDVKGTTTKVVQTLEEAQARWDRLYADRKMPPGLEDRLRPVSKTIQADRAFSDYTSESGNKGYEAFQEDNNQPAVSRIEYLTRFIVAKNPQYSQEEASGIAEKAIEENLESDKQNQAVVELGRLALDLDKQEPEYINLPHSTAKHRSYGTAASETFAHREESAQAAQAKSINEQRRQDLQREKSEARSSFDEGVHDLRKRLISLGDYHQLAALNKFVAEVQTEAAWNVEMRTKAILVQATKFSAGEEYLYALGPDGKPLTDKPLSKSFRTWWEAGKTDKERDFALGWMGDKEKKKVREEIKKWRSAAGFSHFGHDPQIQLGYGTSKQGEWSKDNPRGLISPDLTIQQYGSIIKILHGEAIAHPEVQRAKDLSWIVLNDPLVRAQQAMWLAPEIARLFGVEDKTVRTVTNDVLTAPIESLLNVATAGWNMAATVEDVARRNPDGWLRENIVNSLVQTTNALSSSSAMLGKDVYGEDLAGWTTPIRSGLVSLGQIAIYTTAGVPWYMVTGGYFSQSYAQSYHEAKTLGLTGKKAVKYGVAMGAAEAIPEIAGAYLQMKFGFGAGLMKYVMPGQKLAIRAAVREGWSGGLKHWMPVVKALLIQAPETVVSEQVQEFSTLVMQSQARVMFGIEPDAFDPEVFKKKAFDTFLSTVVASFGGATVLPGFQHGAEIKRLRNQLVLFSEQVKSINIDAVKTKTRDEYQEFLHGEYQKIIASPLFENSQAEEYVDLLEKIYDYSQQSQETPADWFAQLFVQMFPGQAQLIADGNASRNSFREAFIGTIPLGLENAAARAKFQSDLKAHLQKLDNGILAERQSLAVDKPEITTWYVPIEEFYTEQETYTDENGNQRVRKVQRRRETHVRVKAGSMDEASDIVHNNFKNDPNRNVTSRTDQTYHSPAEEQGELFDTAEYKPEEAGSAYTADATIDPDTNLPVAEVEEVSEILKKEFGEDTTVKVIPANERKPDEFLEWFTEVLNRSGIGVEFFTVAGAKNAGGLRMRVPGYFHKGTVFIDPTASRKGEKSWGRDVIVRVMAHEGLAHGLTQTHPELAKYLTDRAGDIATPEEKRAAGYSVPTKADFPTQDAIYSEEVLARVLEREFADIAAGRFKGDQNMLKRLANWARSVMSKLGLRLTSGALKNAKQRQFKKDLDNIVRQLFAGKTFQELELPEVGVSTTEAPIVGRPSAELNEKIDFLKRNAPNWLQEKPKLLDLWAKGEATDTYVVREIAKKYRQPHTSGGFDPVLLADHGQLADPGDREFALPALDQDIVVSGSHAEAFDYMVENAIGELEGTKKDWEDDEFRALDKRLGRPSAEPTEAAEGQLTRDIGRALAEPIEPYEGMPEGWEYFSKPEKIKAIKGFVKRFVDAQPEAIKATLEDEAFLTQFEQNRAYNKAAKGIIQSIIDPRTVGRRDAKGFPKEPRNFTVKTFKEWVAAGNDESLTNIDEIVEGEWGGDIVWGGDTGALWGILTEWASGVEKGGTSITRPEFNFFFNRDKTKSDKVYEETRDIVELAYEYAESRGLKIEPPEVDYWNLVDEYRGAAIKDLEGYEAFIKSIGEEGWYSEDQDEVFDQEAFDDAKEMGIEISLAYRSIRLLRNATSDQDLSRLRKSYLDWLVYVSLATQTPVTGLKNHLEHLGIKATDAAHKYLKEVRHEVVAEASVLLADNETMSPTIFEEVASKLEALDEQIDSEKMLKDKEGNYVNHALNGAAIIAKHKYADEKLTKAAWLDEMKRRFPRASKSQLLSKYKQAQEDASYMFSPDRTSDYNKRLSSINQSRQSKSQKDKKRIEIATMAALKRQLRREERISKKAFRNGAAEAKRRTAEHYKEKIKEIRDKAKEQKKVSRELVREYDAVLRGMGATSAKFTATLPRHLRRPNFRDYEAFVEAADEVAKRFEMYKQAQAQNDLRSTLIRMVTKNSFNYPDEVKALIKKHLAPMFAEMSRVRVRKAKGREVSTVPGKVTEAEIEATFKALYFKTQQLAADISQLIKVNKNHSDIAGLKYELEKYKAQKGLFSGPSIESLSEEQAILIRDSLLQLSKLSALKDKLEGKQSRKKFQAAQTEFIENISARLKELGEGYGRTYDPDKARSLRHVFSRFHLFNPHTMMQWLSGGKENSGFAQLVYSDLDEGQDAVFSDINEDTDYLVESLKAVGIDLSTGKGVNALLRMSLPYAKRRSFITSFWTKKRRTERAKVDIHKIALSSGKTLHLTPAERMSLLMHFQDPDTYSLIRQGTPISIGKEGRAKDTYSLSIEDISSIVNLFENKRDVEQELADVMMSRINGTMRHTMQAYSLEQKGIDITKDTMYFPRVRASFVQEMEDSKDDPMEIFNKYSKILFDSVGITKERTADTTSAIALQDAFTVFRNHSMMVSGLRHMAAPLNNLYRMLKDKTTKEAMAGVKGGDRLRSYYETRIGALAKDFLGIHATGGIGIPDRVFDTIARKAVRFFTLNALGLNPRVAFYQVASVLTAASQMPKGSMIVGLRGVSDRSLNDEIYEHDPYLRSRSTGSGVGLLSEGAVVQRNQPFVEPHGAFGTKGNRHYQESVMFMIRAMDAMAIRAIWSSSKAWVESDIRGGKLLYPDDHVDTEKQGKPIKIDSTEYWAEVSKRARKVVKISQPTSDSMHLSGIALQAKTDISARLLTMYQAQRNKNFNMQALSIMKLARSKWSPKQITEAIVELSFHTAAQQTAVSFIKFSYAAISLNGLSALIKAITGATPPDDEDEGWWSWLGNVLIEAAVSTTTEVPLFQYVTFAFESALYVAGIMEKRPYDPAVSPAISATDDIIPNLSKALEIVVGKPGTRPVFGGPLTGDENLAYRLLLASPSIAMGVGPAHVVREIKKANDSLKVTYTNQFNKIYNNAIDAAKNKVQDAKNETDRARANKQMKYITTFWRPPEMRSEKGDEGFLLVEYKKTVMVLIKELEGAKKDNDKEKIDATVEKLESTIRKIRGKIDLFNANPEAWDKDRRL